MPAFHGPSPIPKTLLPRYNASVVSSSDRLFTNLSGLSERFDQIQKMAIGGMAEVYRARQKLLDRPVAIKRIRPELKSYPEIQERFRREARTSANLLHHNIAHVYAFESHQDESYIIMEWVDGMDLAEILEKTGRIPAPVAACIVLKVAQGLSYIHSHGLVHRDIKPDNIRISIRGEVKIMDFGIALDPGEGNMTLPGTLVGSPHYLAPEQVQGGKINAKADLFSFGITLYQLLSGQKPFVDGDGQTVFQRITKGKYPPLSQFGIEVPAPLQRLLETCLEVDPAKRPHRSDDVAAVLQQYVQSSVRTSPEQKIRQFLIERALFSGRSDLVEVSEVTNPRLSPERQWLSPLKKWAWWAMLVLAGFVFGRWAFPPQIHSMQDSQPPPNQTNDASSETKPPTPQKAIPKQPRPKPQSLPGNKIQRNPNGGSKQPSH